jgi:hypothetical protein
MPLSLHKHKQHHLQKKDGRGVGLDDDAVNMFTDERLWRKATVKKVRGLAVCRACTCSLLPV